MLYEDLIERKSMKYSGNSWDGYGIHQIDFYSKNVLFPIFLNQAI